MKKLEALNCLKRVDNLYEKKLGELKKSFKRGNDLLAFGKSLKNVEGNLMEAHDAVLKEVHADILKIVAKRDIIQGLASIICNLPDDNNMSIGLSPTFEMEIKYVNVDRIKGEMNKTSKEIDAKYDYDPEELLDKLLIDEMGSAIDNAFIALDLSDKEEENKTKIKDRKKNPLTEQLSPSDIARLLRGDKSTIDTGKRSVNNPRFGQMNIPSPTDEMISHIENDIKSGKCLKCDKANCPAHPKSGMREDVLNIINSKRTEDVAESLMKVMGYVLKDM